MKLVPTLAALALLVGSTAVASAQEADQGKTAGSIMVRLRGVGVIPQPSSSVSLIGGYASASNTAVPEIDGSYFITDNLAVELIAATTQHRITAEQTALGHVDLGTVRLLPPTLTAQWHFLPKSQISPYIGAGINYTFFFDNHAAGGPVQKVTYENNVGGAIQAGIDFQLKDRWYLNLDVKQLFLNTTAKVNGGVIRANVDLNPTLVGVGIGYRF